MTNAALRRKPDAGSPHVRFDEEKVAQAPTPRRGTLLDHIRLFALAPFAAALTASSAGLPFWGDATPMTNRPPAAAAAASPSRGFESRICIAREQGIASFTSEGRGTCIFVR